MKSQDRTGQLERVLSHAADTGAKVVLIGYIAGPSGDVSKFAFEGPVVEDYQSRMAEYRVAIMGKATYKFGYQYGLKRGANPYDHMQTKVISKTLVCSSDCKIEVVCDLNMDIITKMKMTVKGPIYLCGGSDLAGQLLRMGAIDELRLKRSPIVLGGGVSLFG
nr:dihydrofolate reductase family protein [Rhodophyticola porphyridii]